MIQVGQKLWYVPRDSRIGKPREVTVLKVGRKWAELDNRHRIDIETLVADGKRMTAAYLARLSEILAMIAK